MAFVKLFFLFVIPLHLLQLSLFAESTFEMLQYQMGCRLLAFLEKLRIKFVRERNQRKRQREETPAKESDKETEAIKVY
ncbi:protein SHORT ROOT IN SALT MEDIUM 1-like isoform X1 [Magnolia sinica]|uniref:protein SHORT ROOT IN SALT MEDIUM 1-like isoform X1 n=1 Tax=Magnolia sinica TaxID=86752 RepID=UPI0026583431|nr:protein SHORT ROOT IN SALT MEDIUM 1-like isoform X1 [Magnolia sinica]